MPVNRHHRAGVGVPSVAGRPVARETGALISPRRRALIDVIVIQIGGGRLLRYDLSHKNRIGEPVADAFQCDSSTHAIEAAYLNGRIGPNIGRLVIGSAAVIAESGI